jgi:hypothetical protein
MKKRLVLAGMIGMALVVGTALIGCTPLTDATQYTVTYAVGLGGGTAPATQTVDEGTAITLPGQGDMTAPAGELFDGWKDDGGTA